MDKKILKKYLVGEFSALRVLRSLVSIYVCLLVFAWVWSDQMIFQPQAPTYTDSASTLKIEMGSRGPISAIYLENPDARFTILYNHANAVDLGDIHGFLSAYRDKGFSVLSYDYPGYGTSPGRPTSANSCKAADAALNYLAREQGVPMNRIIVHGRSVGGGPALYLAHAHEVAGVIVESSFVTAFRVLTQVPLTPFDKFRNISRIADVRCPVLVIHGQQDRIIPFWHGEKLFEKAREPKISCWLDGATHNDISAKAETAYWAAIVSFSELVDAQQGITEGRPGAGS